MKNRLGFFDRRASNWEKVHYPPYVRQRLEALVKEFQVREVDRMRSLLMDAGVFPLEIVNKPGKYLARGKKEV